MNSERKDNVRTRCYLITVSGDLSNYRAKKISSLQEPDLDIQVVSKTRGRISDNLTCIGSFPNPTGFLKIFGLKAVKEKIDKYLFFPTPDVLFVYKAYFYLKKRIKEDLKSGRRIIILTITPPHALSMLGFLLKKKYPGIKFICDWQDLWTYDEYHVLKTAPIYQKRLKKLENRTFDACDINVTTNFKASEVLIKTYGVKEAKILDIVHPYDESELLNTCKKLKGDVIKIGFLGNLYKLPKVSGDILFDSIDYVNLKGLNLELCLYGDETEETKQAVFRKKFKHIRFFKKVTHQESINKICECDFLTLCITHSANAIITMHGKLSHYLLLKKPIIAFVPDDSFVAWVIKKTKSGYVISDIANAGQTMLDILEKHDDQHFMNNINHEEIVKYSWENIRKKWVSVLNEI